MAIEIEPQVKTGQQEAKPMRMPQKKDVRGRQALELVKQLREEIIAGHLLPETPLRQELLADQYQVSRMPVREAMRILAAEGLVTLIPNKGARVAPITSREVYEIYKMRLSAETLALTEAIPEMSDRHIDQAVNQLSEIETCNPNDYGRLNKAFHLHLYAPCQMPRLLAHISELSDLSDRYLRLTVKALDYADKSNAEHYELLTACRKRDVTAAVKILKNHIEQAGQSLHDYLTQQEKSD